MLTIICGEDTPSSRTHFVKLQEEYKKKGYFIASITPKDIETVQKEEGLALNLFNDKKAYFMQGLNSVITRAKNKAVEETLQYIIKHKEIEVVDWEDGKSAREIKIKGADVKEFKPEKTIFQLLDACYPTNLINFSQILAKLAEEQEEGFIFAMLCRHIRTLLLAKTNNLPTSVPFWMKKKLVSQADYWSIEKLVGFYEGLSRIDVASKTSSNIYGMRKSIEILGCYFLR